MRVHLSEDVANVQIEGCSQNENKANLFATAMRFTVPCFDGLRCRVEESPPDNQGGGFDLFAGEAYPPLPHH